MEEYDNVQRLGASRNDMYWIVYQTTNLVNNKIYIGVHKTPTPYTFDGYLGCGVYINSPQSYESCKTKFECAIKKYGVTKFRRITLKVFDNEEDAYLEEARIVDEEFLARSDVYNMIIGGQIHYTQTKFIKVYQYDLSGNYIKGYSSFREAAKMIHGSSPNISAACANNRVYKNSFWSKEKLDKLDIAEYTIHEARLPLYMYSADGRYLGEFPNSKKTGYTRAYQSAILGSLVYLKYYFCLVKADSYDKARDIYVKSRVIYQYDSDGNFIRGWKYLDALKKYSTDRINQAIKHKELTKSGHYWGLYKLPIYNKSSIKQSRKVGKFDTKGNLIKIYDTVSACYKENGGLAQRVLNGTRKTHKGFVYKYMS